MIFIILLFLFIDIIYLLTSQYLMSLSSSDYSQQISTQQNNEKKLYSITSTERQSSSLVQDQYQSYFSSVLHEIMSYNLLNIPYQVLQHHKIRIISKQNPLYGQMINEGYFYAQNSSSRFCGIQCRYDVVIGNFFLIIDVLNLNRDSGQKKDHTKNIGSGHFGVVRQTHVQDKKIAIKRLRIYHNDKKEQNIGCLTDPKDECRPKVIKRAIKQYCIYKICSMLEIGPQIIFNNVYDLVCYNDTIQFQMQLCEKVDQSIIKSDYVTDLKRSVALLHSIKFAHNDIKLQNILYSPSLKKYVLGDFGLAQSIKQKINQKTETYFRGTLRYSSEEMGALHFSNKPGFVNLYMNDVHGLEMTLSEIRYHQSLLQFEKNSLSEKQSNINSQSNNNICSISDSSKNQQPSINSGYSDSSMTGSKNENKSSEKNESHMKKKNKISEQYPSSGGQKYSGSSMNQFQSNLNQISQNSEDHFESSQNSQDESTFNKKMNKKNDKIIKRNISEQIQQIIQKYNFNVAVDIVNPELFTNYLFEKYYSQINYYQMKTIFYILKKQRQNIHVSKLLYIFSQANSFRVYLEMPNQEQLSQLIKQTVMKVCEKQTNKQIIQLVANLVLDSLKPQNPFYSIIVSTRNIIRTFGFCSDQTQHYLKRLIKKKLNDIPLINILKIDNKQLQKIILFIMKEKQQQYMLANNKKIDKEWVHLDNHLRFMNWKALNKQLKYLLNHNVNNITEDLNQLKIKNIMKAFSCFFNQGDYDFKILMKMLQISQKILSFYSLTSSQNDPQIKQDPTEQIFKYFKLKLLDNILKITLFRYEKQGKESFCTIFSNYKNLQASIYPTFYALPKLWSKFLIVEKKFLQSVQLNQKDIQNTEYFTQFMEHLCIILEGQDILSSSDYIRCYQLAQKYQSIIKNSTHQNNSYFKQKILKIFVKLAIIKSDFHKAYELNELNFQLMKKNYFPKFNTEEFFNYYTQKAQILYKERRFYEALQNYNKSLDILLETFRQNSQKNDLINLMNNISCCYDELEDYQNQEKINQQILEIALEWKSCKVVTKIYLLDNIIRCRLRLRKTDGIKERFERLVQWKLELLKEFQNNDPEFIDCGRQLQAFIFLTNQNLPLSTDSIMVYAKKAFLSVLENTIPNFIISYRKCIEDIAYYYTAKQMHSKALPYLSLYFIRFPLTGIREQQFYLKVDFYAAMLINAQSNRRAYQFLKKFIYKVPKELTKIRSQLFRKLYLLSREIGEKNSTLYGLIYKNKAFQNEENCNTCLEIVQKMDIKFLSLIYGKIMKLVSFSLSNPLDIDLKKQMLEFRVSQKNKQRSNQDINIHKEKLKQTIMKCSQKSQEGYFTEIQLKERIQINKKNRLNNKVRVG